MHVAAEMICRIMTVCRREQSRKEEKILLMREKEGEVFAKGRGKGEELPAGRNTQSPAAVGTETAPWVQWQTVYWAWREKQIWSRM